MKSEQELVEWLADPENLDKFLGVAITQSLGYGLTEDGEWAKLDT